MLLVFLKHFVFLLILLIELNLTMVGKSSPLKPLSQNVTKHCKDGP